MTAWKRLLGERIVMYSPVGFRLVDDFTTREPIGRVGATLELAMSPGHYVPVDVTTRVTPSAIVVFPGLERRRDANLGTPRRYRIKLTAELYTPHYRGTVNGSKDGIDFNAYPYNDDVAPALDPQYIEVALLPAVNYPYESQYPVIHGDVVDTADVPVAGVLVSHTAERTYTDANGRYSLPIRFESTSADLLAEDLETGRHGSKTVSLTDITERDRNLRITIQP